MKYKRRFIKILQFASTLSVTVLGFPAQSFAPPQATSPDKSSVIVAYLLTWSASADGHGKVTQVHGVGSQDTKQAHYQGTTTGKAIVQFRVPVGSQTKAGFRYALAESVRFLDFEVNENYQLSAACTDLTATGTGNQQVSANQHTRWNITNPSAYAGSVEENLLWTIEKRADGFLEMNGVLGNLVSHHFTRHELHYDFPQTYTTVPGYTYKYSCFGSPGDSEATEPGYFPFITDVGTQTKLGGFSLKATTPGDNPTGFLVQHEFSVPFSGIPDLPVTMGQSMFHGRWLIRAHRLGACAEHGWPLQDSDPVIQDEDVTITPNPDPNPITPDGKAKLHITVTCDQVPVQGAEVEVSVDPQKYSGGHHHHNHRARGLLNDKELTDAHPSVTVKTDAKGEAAVKFEPPVHDPDHSGSKTAGIAGIYEATAKPTRFPEHTAKASIEVKFPDLQPLPYSPSYSICGRSILGCKPGQDGVGWRGTTTHPDGMWGTVGTLSAIENLGKDFLQFEERMQQDLEKCNKGGLPVIRSLSVNDIALPGGGRLDINANWSHPHQTHGAGLGFDVNHFKEYGVTFTLCDEVKVNWEDFFTDMLLSLGTKYGHWDYWDFDDDNLHLHVGD